VPPPASRHRQGRSEQADRVKRDAERRDGEHARVDLASERSERVDDAGPGHDPLAQRDVAAGEHARAP
jgi:hypothetical protein